MPEHIAELYDHTECMLMLTKKSDFQIESVDFYGNFNDKLRGGCGIYHAISDARVENQVRGLAMRCTVLGRKVFGNMFDVYVVLDLSCIRIIFLIR